MQHKILLILLALFAFTNRSIGQIDSVSLTQDSIVIAADTFITKQDTVKISLSEAITKGLESNYQVKISEKQLEIAENNDSWGKAGRLPTINFSLTQNNIYDDSPATPPMTGRSETIRHLLTPGVNLNWVLFSGFALSISQQTLAELRKISEESLQVQIENTIIQIVLGYYNISMQEQKLGVLAEVMELSRDRYDYVLTRKELGSAVTFDVLQVKDAFLKDSSNYILQKLSLDNSIRDFNRIMADTSYIVYEPTDEFKANLEEFAFQDLKDAMFENNKMLKLKLMNQIIVENTIKLEQSSRYPSLSLFAGAENPNYWVKPIDGSLNHNYSYNAYAGVSLNYTIFNGFNRRRNIQNAKIEQEIGELEIKDLELNLNNQLLSMVELYNARKQLYRVADENVKTMQLNLSIAKDKFSSGAINSFNYRDIQLSYIYANFNRLEAIYALIGAYNDLLRLTGGIIATHQQ